MADKLTPQQHQAVHNRGGNLLVSAAAGSGKTKVLVDRLLTYLTDSTNPANLDEFLIITYTKAAASELRGKIAAKLTEKIAQTPGNRHLQKQMQHLFLTKISTVHGFCGDLLRQYAYQLDLPADFRVGDENECREIRNQVLDDLLDRAYEQETENNNFRVFIDTQGLGRDDRLIPEIIEKVYDSARCHLNPAGWLQDCLKEAQTDHVQDASETVWGRYLMDDLHIYLERQIHILQECIQEMEKSGGMEKVSENIRSTLYQLQHLQNAKTWDDIVDRRSVDYGRLVFPKKNVDSALCERIKAARNGCKNGLDRKLRSFSDHSSQILIDLTQSASGVRGLIALVRQFDVDYCAAKRSRRILDFSDLEHKALDLLLGSSRSGPTAVAKEVAARYREILVDEYQDSNGVQDKIFEALTCHQHNCFLVGDVKQSIYQFRLADPGIFLEKYHRYLPAEDALPSQGRKVLLSHNFRSGPEVIACVNDVFRACMRPSVGGLYYGEDEMLREGISHTPLPDCGVELYALQVQEDTYAEEASFVAERICTMLREGTLVRKNGEFRPVCPEDIVILLRSPGSAAGYFQQALETRGIRCSTGGGADLLHAEEICAFRSLLQTIWNPRQDIPLVGALASPIFGFTADDLASIRSVQKKGFIYDALRASSNEKSDHFLKVLSQLRTEARMNPLTTLLESCLRLTRLDSIYAAMPGGEERCGNIQLFFQLASDFEKGSLKDLGQFLDYLESLENRGVIVSSGGSTGCVNIMSIHKSKGLEFPVVFLCNLSRKFNQESIRAQILCDKTLGLGLSVADMQNRVRYPSVAKRAIATKMTNESISEELRVLYVAMTRAKDRLIMTYAAKRLENDLRELALRQDFDGGELLCTEAICMGDWVLLAALQHIEAGELHKLGGTPKNTRIDTYPWKIQVIHTSEKASNENSIASVSERKFDAKWVNVLKRGLSAQYPASEATRAPSKMTATDRKGRLKDSEAAENTHEYKHYKRSWRQPAFFAPQDHGRNYGSAMHAALQYIQYEKCGTAEEVAQEICRLVDCGFLTLEQGQAVNHEKLARFFSTEIGKKLRTGVPHIREFKFSILDNGSHYGEGLAGEQVLLQGVVDCALLEEDGITVIDFKTDGVSEEYLPELVEHYRMQVQTYGEALSRIYEKPIKAQYLYFFRLDRFIQV